MDQQQQGGRGLRGGGGRGRGGDYGRGGGRGGDYGRGGGRGGDYGRGRGGARGGGNNFQGQNQYGRGNGGDNRRNGGANLYGRGSSDYRRDGGDYRRDGGDYRRDGGDYKYSGGGGGNYHRSGGRGGSPPFRESVPYLHQARISTDVISEGINNLDITSCSTIVPQLPFTFIQPDSCFPTRPEAGTIGRKCKVQTNHYLLVLEPFLQCIYHYNVNIDPEITKEAVNREVMKYLGKSYNSIFGDFLLAYDGQKSFYTARELPFVAKEFKVILSTLPRSKRELTVTITLVKNIDVKNGSTPEAVQALDVVLRQSPISNVKYVPVRRTFCCKSSETVKSIGDGLVAWKGFYQSIRPTLMGLSLNFDISHVVFYEPLEIMEFVKLTLCSRDIPEYGQLSIDERLKIKNALKELKVEAVHSRRKYTVRGLTTQSTDQLTFLSEENGRPKHVVQYFNEVYSLKLKYTSWPCLQVGSKSREIFMPMEVCKIADGHMYKKKLNESQTRKFVQLNNNRPDVRQRDIIKMVRENDYDRDVYAKEFGMKISGNPASVDAHILPAPELSYGSSAFQPVEGQWNMKDKRMFNGGAVNSWCCVSFARNVNKECARAFCRHLADVCKRQGMVFNYVPVLNPSSDDPRHVERALNSLVNRLGRCKLDLLIVILSDRSLHGEVKRICETKLGLISQCFLPETVETTFNKNPFVALANLPSKINTKVGGVNMVIKNEFPKVSEKATIIFGADVTHPNAGEHSTPSIAAVVASLCWPYTKYIPEYSAQDGHQEIILDMGRMVKEHFHSFVQLNKRKPESIIYYRDGVSEGQFAQVLEYEVDAIKKAWTEKFGEASLPPITFIVVQKRHRTKLFPTDCNQTKSGNVMPGTLVDSTICHPSHFDFYLCSHAGMLGTSRPAHYHVLRDDNNFTVNEIQTLSNNLCYMYSRCTRSVSYPAPVYYAHLLAFRARSYLGDDLMSDGNSMLSDKTTHSAETLVKQIPRLCENLKNCPIYC